jgi:hypothetical protein
MRRRAVSDELSTAPEPIHWCDLFRDLERVMTPDPRYLSRSVLDPTVGARQMTMEDHWQDIATIDLHEGVPRSIHVHFDTARNLLLHSWFVYRFQQVAEMHAYASVEFALRHRAGLPLRRTKKKDLRVLLGRAAREGWIHADGFQRYREAVARRAEYEEMEGIATGREPEPSRSPEVWYVRMLADLLPEFRNKLAHGTAMVAPSGKRTLALCCDLINQLFPVP